MRFRLDFKPRLSAHERYVAGWLLLAMVVVPSLALIWPAVTGRLSVWWVHVGARVGAIVLTALVVGGVMRRIPKFRTSVTPLTYAHAFMSLALVWLLYGFLVLLTGRMPSKIIHRQVPRLDSIVYLGVAGGVALLAVLCGWVAERSRTRE